MDVCIDLLCDEGTDILCRNTFVCTSVTDEDSEVQVIVLEPHSSYIRRSERGHVTSTVGPNMSTGHCAAGARGQHRCRGQ